MTFINLHSLFNIVESLMKEQIQSIQISEFQYDLPDHRIAKYPLTERDKSKLLLFQNGAICEKSFSQLPDLLPDKSLLVFNNTKVIQARLFFYKETGAKIELFCLEPDTPNDYLLSFQANSECSWLCMIGNSKKWKEGVLQQNVVVNGRQIALSAERTISRNNSQVVRFSWNDGDVTFAQILDAIGELPIPPYLNRATDEADKTTYQTVYSKIDGSVAAPTAGLHFTERVFANLQAKDISTTELTLHVGAGTFQPVKSSTIGDHEMHTEFISVNKVLIESLLSGRVVVAVGTTSVRTLESLYYIGCLLHKYPSIEPVDLKVTQWMPYSAEFLLSAEDSLNEILRYFERNACETLATSTQIMIVPGYQFKVVKGIVTNFHQPSSTLLLLVSAFVDGRWRDIYDYALANEFRFLSYGDSSLLLK